MFSALLLAAALAGQPPATDPPKKVSSPDNPVKLDPPKKEPPKLPDPTPPFDQVVTFRWYLAPGKFVNPAKTYAVWVEKKGVKYLAVSTRAGRGDGSAAPKGSEITDKDGAVWVVTTAVFSQLKNPDKPGELHNVWYCTVEKKK